MNLFTEFAPRECRDCGFALETPERAEAHQCFGGEFNLDRAIAVFLNRWIWRTENRAVVEKELRELIAEAVVSPERSQ